MSTTSDFQKEAAELADVPMHEEKDVSEYLRIQRVPGGWNYRYYAQMPDYRQLVTVVFVPLPKALLLKLGA